MKLSRLALASAAFYWRTHAAVAVGVGAAVAVLAGALHGLRVPGFLHRTRDLHDHQVFGVAAGVRVFDVPESLIAGDPSSVTSLHADDVPVRVVLVHRVRVDVDMLVFREHHLALFLGHLREALRLV